MSAADYKLPDAPYAALRPTLVTGFGAGARPSDAQCIAYRPSVPTTMVHDYDRWWRGDSARIVHQAGTADQP